jgi:hypothetical protein
MHGTKHSGAHPLHYIPFSPPSECTLYCPGQSDYAGTTLTDKSGNSNDGVMSNTAWKKNNKGIWTAYYNGTDAATTFSDAASLRLGTDFTLEMWICIPSLGTYQLFSKTNASTAGYMLYAGNNGSLGLACYPNTVMASSTATICVNRFFHVVAIHTDGAGKFYVNGVDRTNAGTCDNPGDSTGIDLYIGKLVSAGANWMLGYSAIPRIYKDYAMSLPVAGSHYSQERHLFGV